MTGPADLEKGTPEFGLEAAPELTARRRQRDVVDWRAVAATALAHAVLLAWLIADWNGPPPPPAAPAPIPVALVMALPPAPPPRAPPPPQQAFRQSGPDQQTTAAPEAAQTAPTPEAPQPTVPEPKPEPVPAPDAKLAVEAPPAAAPPKPQQEPPRRPKQEAQLPRAPRPAPPEANRALGEETKTGDPYLNRVWTLIQHNRPPTTPMGPAGLHLEGIAVFAVALGRSGEVQGIRLVQSSGAPQLDEAAERMIVKAEPFPPLPPDYPDRVVIAVSLHLFPEMN
ncbi:MAG TPA: TonB family protein [Stellaceae bacterium]|nr:TonB family protein [Stellaceae bacterium]